MEQTSRLVVNGWNAMLGGDRSDVAVGSRQPRLKLEAIAANVTAAVARCS